MAVTIKRITLWKKEVDDQPGQLAEALCPLAPAGVDLQVVMAYRYPGNEHKAAFEVYPISGKKAIAAAREAGLSETSIAALLVQGDNKAGIGCAISEALGGASVSMIFLMAQVVGRKYSVVIGFSSDADAKAAAAWIKKAVKAKR
jgi:hypothetical protein